MRNILRVFARDLKRIAKAPAVLSVLLFLVLLPSLYSWFNVAGFWNPYDNTQNMRICVVNQDKGVSNELLGNLDLGKQIVEQLEQNSQLGWVFMDYDSAIEEVDSGKAYAAFVIPETFSADIATIISTDFHKPQLQYYVNEKLNPVSPKVVDTGASTLETTINNTFVGTVSQTVADTLNNTYGLTKDKVSQTRSQVAGKIGDASNKLGDTRSAITDLKVTLASAAAKAQSAQNSLNDAHDKVGTMTASLQDISSIAAILGTDMSSFATTLSTSTSKALTDLSQASSAVNVVVGKLTGNVVGTQGTVDAAINNAQMIVNANSAAVTRLEGLEAYIPESSKQLYQQTIDTLKNINTTTQTSIDGLKTISSDMTTGAQNIESSSNNANQAVQQAIDATGAFNDQVSQNVFPSIISGIATISKSCSELSAAIQNQSSLLDQASSVLCQLQSLFKTSADALSQTDRFIEQIQDDLNKVQTDVVSLETSQTLTNLLGEDGRFDSEKIKDFMSSPTQVETERLYPLNAYGSGMAPLFINLTLWIGAFMLIVIIRLEVDEDGIEDTTITQRFIGRGILLAILATLQAVICVAGCLFIGVQTANATVFFLTAIICSLTYLSLQYTLSTTFQHIGMGICVILVFLQIPAATGLYPVELTTQFFQRIYTAFPFTYGINAMREAISGFYGFAWWEYIFVLFVFWLVFLLIGIFVRPLLTNANLMFARQLSDSDLVNCESVHLPMRRFKIVQAVKSLYGHNEFKKPIEDRAKRFMHLYPRLKVGAVVLGIVVPIIFGTVMKLTTGEKVIVLIAWLIWLFAVMIFLIVIESIRDSLARRTIMERMQNEELDNMFVGLRERRRRRKAAERDAQAAGGEVLLAGVQTADGGVQTAGGGAQVSDDVRTDNAVHIGNAANADAADAADAGNVAQPNAKQLSDVQTYSWQVGIGEQTNPPNDSDSKGGDL